MLVLSVALAGLASCLLALHSAQVGLSGVVEDKYSCPHGWTRYGAKKCLKYVNELQDYERAQATCRSKNQGTLVTVHSHEEQNFVYSYIHSIAASSTPIWLGAKQIDFESILWLDKTENSYTNWAPSEPSHPDEICIAINPRNGMWHDVMCTEANVPACERAPTTQWPFFVAFCSEGWFQFNDEKCVRIISSQALNFYESQELCRSKYNSKLLSIKTDKESEFVHNLIKFRDVKLPVWLGAVQNDFSSFNWIDKSDVTFTNWAEGEPNDPDHACISMVASGGKWSDNDCKEQKLILCQKVPEEGSCETGWLQFRQDKCYRFVHIRLAFDDAESLCNNLYGGHLPSIHSQEEQFMIAQFLASVNVKNGSEIWLGGRQMDFHNFNWGDGSPFNYSYWEQGEPSFPAEKCIEMSWRNGRWNDINCRLKRAVLCERQVSSRHHLKPNILYQPTTCLDSNCTTGVATVVMATTTSASSSGSNGNSAPADSQSVALAPGDQLQLVTNGTSNLTLALVTGASGGPELMLPPDDKPIKVIASIMNREHQPSAVEHHAQLAGNASTKAAATTSLTSKSSAGELAPPRAVPAAEVSPASNATFIHYNLPPPERMVPAAVAQEPQAGAQQVPAAAASSPPAERKEPPIPVQEIVDQHKVTVAAAAARDQMSARAPPAPVSPSAPLAPEQAQTGTSGEPATVSLLDKIKPTTQTASAAATTSTSTTIASSLSSVASAPVTSLPEATKPADSNTTALNAPAIGQHTPAQVHPQASEISDEQRAQFASELLLASRSPLATAGQEQHQHQPGSTTQEFVQVTSSAGASGYPRERINQASDGESDSVAQMAKSQVKESAH